MTNKRKRKLMENLDNCYKVVLQSSSKGINAVGISEKLGVHRTTVHNYLNSLELTGKVYNEHGLWFARKDEHEIRPVAKEIVIELPTPKDHIIEESLLEICAKELPENTFPKCAGSLNILLEKLKQTRTIKITAKNVENIDLENLQSLILQAYEDSSKLKSRSLRKYLKFIKGD
jgi:hypothetical protein